MGYYRAGFRNDPKVTCDPQGFEGRGPFIQLAALASRLPAFHGVACASRAEPLPPSKRAKKLAQSIHDGESSRLNWLAARYRWDTAVR